MIKRRINGLLFAVCVLVCLITTCTARADGFEQYTLYGFNRVNVRDEYSSDEVYANFRAVNIGRLGHNVLLRGSSPVDPSLNRNGYADRLIEAYRVNSVINLSDTQKEIDGYRQSKLYQARYYESLLAQNKVLLGYISSGGFSTDEYCRQLTQRLSFIATMPGPYYIHCKEGKDRSGFSCMLLECLMGASYREIADDYLQTFINYTREGYEASPSYLDDIERTNVRSLLGVITGLPNETDFTKVNLAEAAQSYLVKGGMDLAAVYLLKHNLSVSYEDPEAVYEGNCYGDVFDAEEYLLGFPEAASYAGQDHRLALEHFVLYGMPEGVPGNRSFNPWRYRIETPALVEMYGDDMPMYYYYYIRHGQYGEGIVCDDPQLYVTRLYRSFLFREPEERGLEEWSELLRTHRCSGAKAVYGFVFSQEYLKLQISDEQFVTQLYEIVFGRMPDRNGLEAWVTVMRNGATRHKVLEGFLNSLEMKNLCNRMGVLPGTFYSSRFVDLHYQTTAFVANLYREGLERTAAEDELEVWTRALVEGKSASWVAAAFLDGAEFRQREVSDDIFVTILFRTLLKREPGPSEIAFRVGQLAEGMTRGQEVAEICCSDEFGIICSNMQISR